MLVCIEKLYIQRRHVDRLIYIDLCVQAVEVRVNEVTVAIVGLVQKTALIFQEDPKLFNTNRKLWVHTSS